MDFIASLWLALRHALFFAIANTVPMPHMPLAHLQRDHAES
jgi:hypothetical protein